jgi:hypothetical protein
MIATLVTPFDTSVVIFGAATAFWLGIIALVVRLVQVPRSIPFIKLVHSVVFFALSALLIAFVVEVAVDHITVISWSAATLFLAEGVVLLLNGGRCPLTSMAEKLGDSHGQITDTYLPKWFADRVFKFYSVMLVGGMLMFVYRIMV